MPTYSNSFLCLTPRECLSWVLSKLFELVTLLKIIILLLKAEPQLNTLPCVNGEVRAVAFCTCLGRREYGGQKNCPAGRM